MKLRISYALIGLIAGSISGYILFTLIPTHPTVRLIESAVIAIGGLLLGFMVGSIKDLMQHPEKTQRPPSWGLLAFLSGIILVVFGINNETYLLVGGSIYAAIMSIIDQRNQRAQLALGVTGLLLTLALVIGDYATHTHLGIILCKSC